MRAECSILGLVEIVDGVAIAAAVREIADSSCRSHPRSVVAASCLLHASRARERYWESGSHGLWGLLSPTRPWEVIGFEELLSELIAMARMLRPPPRINTGQCYADLWAVPCLVIAKQVKSTWELTYPHLSERAGADA